jgi:DNA-binding transcriptional LysR family regulator
LNNKGEIDVRQIRQIIEVCRSGGIGKAARELGISQPALSRSIARIEDQLGAILFERAGDGAKPTPFADYIISRAVPPMESIAMIAREVRMMAKGDSGRLRVGMGPVIRQLIFLPAVTRILKTFPNLSLKARTGGMPDILKALTTRSIDVAICSSEYSELDSTIGQDDNFVRTDLFTLKLSFFVRKNHKILNTGTPCNAEDLLDYPMVGIGMTRHQRAFFSAKLNAKQRQNLGAYQVDDYDLVRHIILNSDAIGYAPNQIFLEEIRKKEVFFANPDLEILHHCVALALPETWLFPTVSRFVEIAKEVSADLSDVRRTVGRSRPRPPQK